jgi:hypothetical protein
VFDNQEAMDASEDDEDTPNAATTDLEDGEVCAAGVNTFSSNLQNEILFIMEESGR